MEHRLEEAYSVSNFILMTSLFLTSSPTMTSSTSLFLKVVFVLLFLFLLLFTLSAAAVSFCVFAFVSATSSGSRAAAAGCVLTRRTSRKSEQTASSNVATSKKGNTVNIIFHFQEKVFLFLFFEFFIYSQRFLRFRSLRECLLRWLRN